jgi:hypothetical protein
MDAAGRARLDRFEGVGRGYEDAAIEVACDGGSVVCFTYLAQPGHIDEALRPFHWYKALVLAGAEYHGLPAAYVRHIRGVLSAEDPDPARRALHGDLLSRLRDGRPSEHCSPPRASRSGT